MNHGKVISCHSMYLDCMKNNTTQIENYEHTSYNAGLQGACQGGHRILAEKLITSGATDFDGALCGAITGGHVNLVKWIIEKDANTAYGVNSAFVGACAGGHVEIASLLMYVFQNIKAGHVKIVYNSTPLLFSEHLLNRGHTIERLHRVFGLHMFSTQHTTRHYNVKQHTISHVLRRVLPDVLIKFIVARYVMYTVL